MTVDEVSCVLGRVSNFADLRDVSATSLVIYYVSNVVVP